LAATLIDLNRMISWWHTMIHAAKFDAYIDAVAALSMTTVASGHAGGPSR